MFYIYTAWFLLVEHDFTLLIMVLLKFIRYNFTPFGKLNRISMKCKTLIANFKPIVIYIWSITMGGLSSFTKKPVGS